MKYEEIENLLFCPEANDLILDGEYYIGPFFAKAGAEIGDMFLIYTLDGEETCVYRCIIINPQNEKIIECIDNIELVLPSIKETLSISQEYKVMYESIHEFAFDDVLSSKQADILKSFMSLLVNNNFAYMRTVYNDLMPCFFEWIKKYVD